MYCAGDDSLRCLVAANRCQPEEPGWDRNTIRFDRSYFRIVLTIIGLVVTTATVIGMVSFAGSHKAATELTRQLQAQIFVDVK